MAGDDAIDEKDLVLCCALCCVNQSIYPTSDCFGCSGKIGLCCLNIEVCCKVRWNPCVPMCITVSCPALTNLFPLCSPERPVFLADAAVLNAKMMDAAAATRNTIAVAALRPPLFPAMTKYLLLYPLWDWPCTPSADAWFPWRRLWIVKSVWSMRNDLYVHESIVDQLERG